MPHDHPGPRAGPDTTPESRPESGPESRPVAGPAGATRPRAQGAGTSGSAAGSAGRAAKGARSGASSAAPAGAVAGPVSGRPRRSRIQQRNRKAILQAALEVFADSGFSGATLDRIAERSGLSKPNLLYYFPSKEAVHAALLEGLLDLWLQPLRRLGGGTAEPVEQILAYVRAKLEMARTMPRESRLFAGDILHGAPRMAGAVEGPLAALVEEKAALIAGWIAAGRLAPVDPRHLLFSIWATTQHYADFDAQIRALLRPRRNAHFRDAASFLETLYRRALTP